MTGQNLKNHSRLVPLYHFGSYLLLLTALVAAFINLSKAADDELFSAAILLILVIAVIISNWYVRAFALKAQDRAIRAEENFRHFLLTGKPFDSRLHTRQIIALRFASDAELPALAKRAADEDLNSKSIKQAIRDWRGDYYRV